MTDKNKEEVLVIENRPGIHLGSPDYFHVMIDGSESWQEEVMDTASFVPRWLAEKDETTLQLIPYIACGTDDGKVLAYKRKGGGESRLEAKWSIGIGGHINTTDVVKTKISWEIVLEGAVRESVEELHIDAEYVRKNLKQVGVIYTPDDNGGDPVGPGPNVGEVHMGIAYILIVDDTLDIKPDEGMVEASFIELDKIDLIFEKWSELFIQNLPAIIDKL